MEKREKSAAREGVVPKGGIRKALFINGLAFPNFAKAHTESHRLFREIPKLLNRSSSRFACKLSSYKPEADSSLLDRIRRGGPGGDICGAARLDGYR
jgi:hypothetical protein